MAKSAETYMCLEHRELRTNGLNAKMYSMVTIVNNTVLHMWKLLKVNIKNPHHNKKNFL